MTPLRRATSTADPSARVTERSNTLTMARQHVPSGVARLCWRCAQVYGSVMATWTNWSGRQTASPVRIIDAASEAHLVEAVTTADQLGVPVRAVGASHSHSRVAATDGVIVTTDGWQGVVSTDPAARSAVLRSGTRLFQLGEPLLDAGLALRNQGDIDTQAIAGAIATGTHGTGPTLQNLSASVEAVRLVLASGEIATCSALDEPELFEIARHSLGGVGLVSEVQLGVRDAYRLHERQWRIPGEEVLDQFDELIAATRHFEFFWYPQGDWCGAKALAETDAHVDPMPNNKWEYVDWSWKVLRSVRDERHTEMEYGVPAERGPACFAEIRELVLSRFPDVWPVEYRTLGQDDLWISVASGRPTVTISVHQDISLDDQELSSPPRRCSAATTAGRIGARSTTAPAQSWPSSTRSTATGGRRGTATTPTDASSASTSPPSARSPEAFESMPPARPATLVWLLQRS